MIFAIGERYDFGTGAAETWESTGIDTPFGALAPTSIWLVRLNELGGHRDIILAKDQKEITAAGLARRIHAGEVRKP